MRTSRPLKRAALFVAVALAATLMLGVGSALGGAPDVVGPGDGTTPFLCPSVGTGFLNNHPGAGELTDPDGDSTGRYTFLPGNNQAGANANPQSFNAYPASGSPPSWQRQQHLVAPLAVSAVTETPVRAQ